MPAIQPGEGSKKGLDLGARAKLDSVSFDDPSELAALAVVQVCVCERERERSGGRLSGRERGERARKRGSGGATERARKREHEESERERAICMYVHMYLHIYICNTPIYMFGHRHKSQPWTKKQDKIGSNKVMMFSKSGCPFCSLAKQALDAQVPKKIC